MEPTLAPHLAVIRTVDGMSSPQVADLVSDVRAQLVELIRPGFLADAGMARLRDIQRYLMAVRHRLDKAPAELTRDRTRMDEVLRIESSYAVLLERLRPAQRGAPEVAEIAWMIEELRVSLFAQGLGTCLLYTSDAADERSSVDLGGRRIIKKKKVVDERGSVKMIQNTIQQETTETRE